MERKKKDALIFIDTNIYLDFYRTREKTFETNMLEHIEDNRNKIITTDQILMEYKKNRQKVIIKTLETIEKPSINIRPPAFLSNAKCIEMINKSKNSIKDKHNTLKKRVIDVLKNPVAKDDLYKFLQRLFKGENPYHLGRNNKSRFLVRKKAIRRFYLGYPPKKDTDISIGDAINWEWIIHCATVSEKNIAIVSRDSDYGVFYDNQPILNDWLSQEFKERINQQRQIILTNKLSEALRFANVEISKAEEEQENEFIKEISNP